MLCLKIQLLPNLRSLNKVKHSTLLYCSSYLQALFLNFQSIFGNPDRPAILVSFHHLHCSWLKLDFKCLQNIFGVWTTNPEMYFSTCFLRRWWNQFYYCYFQKNWRKFKDQCFVLNRASLWNSTTCQSSL